MCHVDARWPGFVRSSVYYRVRVQSVSSIRNLEGTVRRETENAIVRMWRNINEDYIKIIA